MADEKSFYPGASVVASLLGLILVFYTGPIGAILAIVGIYFGGVQLNKFAKGHAEAGIGGSLGGVIIGIIALLIFVFLAYGI